MPSPVDKYYKNVKKNNPSYSDEQAWATAWSIYCKHKNPGSSHCHKPTGEYLKKKEAAQPILDFAESLLVSRVASRYMESMSWPEDLKDKIEGWRRRKDNFLSMLIRGVQDLDDLIHEFNEINRGVRDRDLRQLIREDVQDADSLLKLEESLNELGVAT